MGHGRWSLSLWFMPDACFAVVTVGSTPPKQGNAGLAAERGAGGGSRTQIGDTSARAPM
ncbi:hypothetical protein NEUTE1DRAFT_100509 [Neurospora tetrasperma FGSC 2508]|uniref:Uncharacterized protein n=1 Tax=Neurospora tetrasperma (strain FGSC 2508 / ATCC MYA-4615 / P0657) TaxID=510951 RepID=F8MLI5_NEUT8|nr:uncharacterized protein NEUTE1DRAFT_100509 [Neurospora tetrasperma FGSC 2508]EGO57607.1 hypothetical protein NEUTE1DRAFT_100509 [Neurospora tetrasperma FGSC 2508]EGZ72125.1 hypothetical protein NEUTE2DRAFT_129504 [Neurospora tetrasperma FGSC 2509]